MYLLLVHMISIFWVIISIQKGRTKNWYFNVIIKLWFIPDHDPLWEIQHIWIVAWDSFQSNEALYVDLSVPVLKPQHYPLILFLLVFRYVKLPPKLKQNLYKNQKNVQLAN